MEYNPLYKSKSKMSGMSISEIFTPKRLKYRRAEPSNSHFTLSHPKRIPFISSPLKHEDEHHGHGSPYEIDHEDSHESNHSEHRRHDDPPLKRSHESSVIQLFYDLFFVANLTTFTSVHEVNDVDTLKSYIGFFALLWFTWFQVAIFDIRFSQDSIVERVFKALQFGVMTGFAVVGPGFNVGFDPEDPEEAVKAQQADQAFQTLSIIMMASRLILAVQYLMVLLFFKRWSKSTWTKHLLPLVLHIAILCITGFIFLGISFTFNPDAGSKPLIGWYVVIGIEAFGILLISGLWRFLSFRNTNIVERLGLLTLIILGEGVIGLCGSVQKIGNYSSWTSDMIGMVICSVVVIYAMWMLYFDQAETKSIGTLRQQLWTLCHFPYHLAILFLLEGCSRMTVWRKVQDTWIDLNDAVVTASGEFNISAPYPITQWAESLNETFIQFYEGFEKGLIESKGSPTLTDLYQSMELMVECGQNVTSDSTLNAIDAAIDLCQQYISEPFSAAAEYAATQIGFEPPETKADKLPTYTDVLNLLLTETFITVFYYFFIAATVALFMTAVLLTLGKRHKVLSEWINIGFRTVLAVGFALFLGIVSAMANSSPDSTATINVVNYIVGPWVLPTITLVYLAVVTADHILRNWTHQLITKKGNHREHREAR